MAFIRNNDGMNASYLKISDLEAGIHNFPHNVFMSLKYLSALSLSIPLDMRISIQKSDLTKSEDFYSHVLLNPEYALNFSHKISSSLDLASFDLSKELNNTVLIGRSNDRTSPNCADQFRAPSWYSEDCGGFLALGRLNKLFYGPLTELKSIYFSVKESSCLKWDQAHSPPKCSLCAEGYILSPDHQCIQCDALRVCENAQNCLNLQAFLQEEEGKVVCKLDRNCSVSLFPSA